MGDLVFLCCMPRPAVPVDLMYKMQASDGNDDGLDPVRRKLPNRLHKWADLYDREKKKRKLGGEEEGHNHQWHTRTAHSAHTGERAPRGPGHRTRARTEGNKGTRHHGLAHR